MKFKPKTITRVLVLLFVFSNIFWLKKSYDQRDFPFGGINELKRKIIKFITITKDGEEAYVDKIVSYQLAKDSNRGNDTNLIETSVLPLTKIHTSLVDNKFPIGGGALAVAEGKVLILDRIGRLYLYDEKTIKKLDFVVPNNLNKYAVEPEKESKLGPNAYRSHSILYDSINARIIVSFTRFEGGVTARMVVASLSINKSNFNANGNWSTIFESPPLLVNQTHQSHNGGGKILLKDNSLFLSVGYNHQEEKNGKWYSKSLDSKSQFGKILKINLDNNKSEIYSKGHRNIQGMSIFNAQYLISTEHGPQGGDEINLVEEGKSYGWPIKTYGTYYGTYDYKLPLEPIETSRDFVEPFFAFVPSIGISPILQVKEFNPRWEGDLLVGSLKAQTLYRLKQAEGRIIFQEPIWIGNRIRDIVELGNKLIILTDNAKIISLIVNEYALSKNTKGNNLIGTQQTVATCMQCHQFSPTTPVSLAPSLLNIFNKKIGSDTYEHYSDALKSYDGSWSEENLKSFIKNPSKLIPGSTMPAMDLTDKEINNIVELLKKQ